MTTARSVKGSAPGVTPRILRFLADAKRAFMPPRRMTTAERRALIAAAAKDPNVERALQELFAERPELRMKNASARDIQGKRE